MISLCAVHYTLAQGSSIHKIAHKVPEIFGVSLFLMVGYDLIPIELILGSLSKNKKNLKMNHLKPILRKMEWNPQFLPVTFIDVNSRSFLSERKKHQIKQDGNNNRTI